MNDGSNNDLFEIGDGIVLDTGTPTQTVQTKENGQSLEKELADIKTTKEIAKTDDGIKMLNDGTFLVPEKNDIVEKPVAPKEGKEKEDLKKEGDTSTKEIDSPLDPLAATLVNEAILPSFKKDEYLKLKTHEERAKFMKDGFTEYIQEGIKLGVEEDRNQLNDRQKDFVDKFKNGFTVDEITNIEMSKVKYSTMTNETLEADEKMQERVGYDYYRATTQWSDVDIQKKLATEKEMGELSKESPARRDKLIEFTNNYEANIAKQHEQNQIAKKAHMDKMVSSTEEYIKGLKEIVPGMPLDDNTKKSLFQQMTTITKEDNGQQFNKVFEARAENPQEFDAKLNYYFSLGLFNDIPDLSKIIKVAETKAVKTLAEQLKEQDLASQGKGSNSVAKSGDKETDDIVKAAFQKFG